MKKNASITAFFKPVPKSSQPSSQPSQALPLSPAQPQRVFQRPDALAPSSFDLGATPPKRAPSRSPTPQLLLDSSPPAPPSLPRDRNAIIQDSDEDYDQDSSDDDLPDLFAAPARKVIPAPPARTGPPCATPRAKRTALGMHSSPLTIMPKHRFDIKALMRHAEADQAVEESAQRMESALAPKSVAAGGAPSTTHAGGPFASGAKPLTTLHETMMNAFSEPEDSQEEGARDKLLRAVQRTEATVDRPAFHFFDPEDPGQKDDGGGLSIEAKPLFPSKAATGIWAFLAQPKHHLEFFEDGVVYHVQESMGGLPDEIFLWVLRQVSAEQSKKLRDEYLRLLSLCPDQAGRMVDQEIITLLFRETGASERVLNPSSRSGSGSTAGKAEAQSSQRDSSRLRWVIQALMQISQGLGLPALIYSVDILLCLAMDNIMYEDQGVAADYRDALYWLIHAVPEESWDEFCGEVCTSLHARVEEPVLRCAATISIPLLSTRLVELRRRLALVSIFDDARLAATPPSTNVSIRAVIDRLESDEYLVDRHSTKFVELAALAEMLGIAVGDGNPSLGSGAAVKNFDAEVDELARRVKVMYSAIPGQGAAFASQLEAKVTLQDLERKLQHATRTRPPPRVSIFGIENNEDEVDRPRQQRFMQRFLQGKMKEPELP
ncbi:hypothetical protein QBC47DRAFT_317745 [Echria macrotheca]|uniref:Uncharacterized protein n=1 Tax=Echria macrotheca TaxID=438768 RepID=A0AAJ0FCL6_9PEZI|nr:hypothetical protein QBC47DRAFT_317745 [Echria macrotheca]